jgi:hypothetical protein
MDANSRMAFLFLAQAAKRGFGTITSRWRSVTTCPSGKPVIQISQALRMAAFEGMRSHCPHKQTERICAKQREAEMIKRVSRIWLALLIVLTVIAGVTVIKLLRIEVVQAAAPTVGVTYTCNPSLVVSANVRVVARCATPYTNGTITIYWFAYPTSDSGNASRMLSLFETAKATGSTVTFYFDTSDTSGTAYGCLSTDCRAIWAATTP